MLYSAVCLVRDYWLNAVKASVTRRRLASGAVVSGHVKKRYVVRKTYMEGFQQCIF